MLRLNKNNYYYALFYLPSLIIKAAFNNAWIQKTFWLFNYILPAQSYKSRHFYLIYFSLWRTSINPLMKR